MVHHLYIRGLDLCQYPRVRDPRDMRLSCLKPGEIRDSSKFNQEVPGSSWLLTAQKGNCAGCAHVFGETGREGVEKRVRERKRERERESDAPFAGVSAGCL